jgi:hypothetical protein
MELVFIKCGSGAFGTSGARVRLLLSSASELFFQLTIARLDFVESGQITQTTAVCSVDDLDDPRWRSYLPLLLPLWPSLIPASPPLDPLAGS